MSPITGGNGLRTWYTHAIKRQLLHVIIIISKKILYIVFFMTTSSFLCWHRGWQMIHRISGSLSEWDLNCMACACALPELSTFDFWNKIQIYNDCQDLHKTVAFNTHSNIPSFSTLEMAKEPCPSKLSQINWIARVVLFWQQTWTNSRDDARIVSKMCLIG